MKRSRKQIRAIKAKEGSTKFSGVGLFDIGNNVGNWEGQTGYRGMMDVWKHKKTGDTVVVEPNEDSAGYEDVFVHNENGSLTSITSAKPDEALAEAKKFMLKHPRGWK